MKKSVSLLCFCGVVCLLISSCENIEKEENEAYVYEANDKAQIRFNDDVTYGSVTDVDGNKYKTVTIDTQTWMAENLKTARYNNGDTIPYVYCTSPEWTDEAHTFDAYCLFNNHRSFLDVYGYLYNWNAATNSRGICPAGWHLPSVDEWEQLLNYVGEDRLHTLMEKSGEIVGDEIHSSHWVIIDLDKYDQYNATGFTALPGGLASDSFRDLNYHANFWTSTSSSNGYAESLRMTYIGIYSIESYERYIGCSIRCIKD